MNARTLHTSAVLAGTFATALLSAGPASAQGNKPLSVTVTSAAARTYDVSVGTSSPLWWVPSIGTTVDFEVAAIQSPAAGRARASGAPSGTIWGTIVMPKGSGVLKWDTTEIRVQVNPDSRESSVSFSGRKVWKLGTLVSASLEDSYTLTSADDQVVPDWTALNAVRVDFTPTGTAFVAQNNRDPDDGDWHTSLRAEQQIADGFSIAASLDNVASSSASKSIIASFSRRW